jgi:two-component system, OmpR family, response regulator MtrA
VLGRLLRSSIVEVQSRGALSEAEGGMQEKSATKMLALVVDDEANVRFFLQETLATGGFEVTPAASGEEARQYLHDTRYDLVLLDLLLGGRVDGMRVLSAARWRWPDIAAVILTGHASLDTAVEAIREGIDGYLRKPVEPAELRQVVREAVQRRQALSRPHPADGQRALQHGPLMIDVDKHVVLRDGQPVDLTPQEFKLLVHLVENKQRVVTPAELVRTVREFQPDSTFEAREVVKWYIHGLRKKIEADPGAPRLIVNVRGVGYRLGE